jgi:acyl-CoA synthetase (AMP-forming)/AMP-acid ligase II
VALISGDARVSWGELGRSIDQIAHALLGRGIGRGARVAILSHNSIAYVRAFFGVLAAGACVVPLPTLASPDAIRAMLADSAAELTLVSRELAAVLPKGAAVLLLDDDAWWRGEPDSEPGVEIAPEDEFNIIYSSGTTGTPKGIVHDHATRSAFIADLGNFAFGPSAVTNLSTPLYSNTTMVAWLPSMCFGATQVLMPKFDARSWIELSERERVTHAMLVPVQYERILREATLATADLSSFLVKLCTSAPLRAGTKRAIVDRMPGALVEIYGLTEGGVTTLLFASARPDKLDSVGQPAPGCRIKIVDDDGRELPPGQTGEVVGRSSFMMKRYENRDDATRAMLWQDEAGDVFYRSGDVGKLDDEGFLYLLDRKKDMIISGGQNVYAADIERVLATHPDVAEVAVIGVPSERWGETPLAVVVPEQNASIDPEALQSWANARLGKHERVSRVALRQELPKSAIGKLLKRELREAYLEGGE